MAVMSIGAALALLAERDPGAVAVRCAGEVLTRGELVARSHDLARRWVADGVRPDDVVAVSLPNGVEVVVALAAAWTAGATPQPLSPHLPAPERRAVVERFRPRLLVDGSSSGSAPGTAPGPPPLPPPSGPPSDGPPLPELAPGLAASCWKAPVTSGSTGPPKVVRAAAPALIDPDLPVAPFVPHRAVQLVAGPVLHGAAFVYAMRGLMTGHELVLMPRPDAGEWLRLVAQHRVTWGVLAPALMHRIARHPGRATADVSSLEAVLHVGARCAPWLKRTWIDWLGPARVHEVYAGTESQGLAHLTGEEWLAHPGSVGRAVAGSRFRVVRPDGSACGPGESGEVLMRRDRPTYRYVGAEPLVRDGWHTLGDSGWLDPDGYLHLGDRLADTVTTAAGPVLPADVEEVLEEHPGVVAAVVVPHPVGGGSVVAAVVEGTASEAELRAWAADRLTPAQRPVHYRRVRGPLRDDAGKVRRSAWRDGCPPDPPGARPTAS